MYIYNADVWCDSCGRRIRDDIARENPHLVEAIDTHDERSYDSDEFPKYSLPGETGSPRHCAADGDCLEALDLEPYGAREDALEGAESVKIGVLVEDQLTDHGIEYLREMLAESPRTPYQTALHAYWHEAFANDL